MLGQNYESFQDFRAACESSREPLDPNRVLGKVYSIDQLRFIARGTGIDLEEVSLLVKLEPRGGIGRRYNTALQISSVRSPTHTGEILAKLDHHLFFPVVTYFRFPDSPHYESLDDILTYLRRSHEHQFNQDFVMNFNGIIEPSGRACSLESVLTDAPNNVLSLLFSCTRILVIPDSQYGSVENYFLARIPVVVRMLFDHRLFEISMPTFSEVAGASSTATNRLPERYQVIVNNVIGALVQYLPDQPRAINFRKVTLYLEQVLEAEDMGWRIEPQHEAAFDLRGLIPLKKILDNFSESLRMECSRRGRSLHPWADVDLYPVFRALKEQSYTYFHVFQAPIGPRGGGYRISALYGPENSSFAPVLWIPDTRHTVAESIRGAVDKSQTAKLRNPYDLDSLFG